jgi:hypothetical protein
MATSFSDYKLMNGYHTGLCTVVNTSWERATESIPESSELFMPVMEEIHHERSRT